MFLKNCGMVVKLPPTSLNHEWRSVTWVVSGLLLVIREERLGLHTACCTYALSNTRLRSASWGR